MDITALYGKHPALLIIMFQLLSVFSRMGSNDVAPQLSKRILG